MSKDNIDINPVVVLSLEGLKRALDCATVKNQAGKYGTSGSIADRDYLASEIILHSIRYEVPAFDRIHVEIKGGQKGSNKREVLLLLEQVGSRVEMVQEILIGNEARYRGNSYARRIDNGTAEFDRLIKWIANIETTYQKFLQDLPPTVEIDPEKFYQFFLDRSYELVGNRAKLSINNFAAVDIHNGVGVHLSKWVRVLSDPYADLTKFMIREVVEVFKLTGVDLIGSYEHYDRIRGGLEILLGHYFPKGGEEAKIKTYVRAWVAVAFEGYEGYAKTIGKQDTKVALGFIGGNTKENKNTALERMEAKLNQLRTERKTEPKEERTIQTPKRKSRKIKQGF